MAWQRAHAAVPATNAWLAPRSTSRGPASWQPTQPPAIDACGAGPRERRARRRIEPAAAEPQRRRRGRGRVVRRLGRVAAEADGAAALGRGQRRADEQRGPRHRAQQRRGGRRRRRVPRRVLMNGVAGRARDADGADVGGRPAIDARGLWRRVREEAPRRVAARARLVRRRARVAIGARHVRRAPGGDVAVARGRVVAGRAHVGAQDAPARRRFGQRARPVTREAADAAEPSQRPRHVLPAPRAERREAELAHDVREPAVGDARLARRVTPERAAGIRVAEGRAVTVARGGEAAREHGRHRARDARRRDRRVTLGTTAVERRLVVASRAQRERATTAVRDAPITDDVGAQARRAARRLERRGGARGLRVEAPTRAAQIHARVDRRVRQPARARGRGDAHLVPLLGAVAVVPDGLEQDLSARARRQRHDAPRRRPAQRRRQRRRARAHREAVVRRRERHGRPRELPPRDRARARATDRPRRDDKGRVEAHGLPGRVEGEALARARRRAPARRDRDEERNDRGALHGAASSRHEPNRHAPRAQSSSSQHAGAGRAGAQRPSAHAAPSTHGRARSQSTPKLPARAPRSHTRVEAAPLPARQLHAPMSASGKSGDRSTHTRSPFAARGPRRAPQIQAASDGPATTPAGAALPRHSVAPAVSTHVHSPSSGRRASCCVHRAPVHENTGAPAARSTQRRVGPDHAQRHPSADAAATDGTGRATTLAVPWTSQQTRRVPTSAHGAPGAADGAGSAAAPAARGAAGAARHPSTHATTARKRSARAGTSVLSALAGGDARARGSPRAGRGPTPRSPGEGATAHPRKKGGAIVSTHAAWLPPFEILPVRSRAIRREADVPRGVAHGQLHLRRLAEGGHGHRLHGHRARVDVDPRPRRLKDHEPQPVTSAVVARRRERELEDQPIPRSSSCTCCSCARDPRSRP